MRCPELLARTILDVFKPYLFPETSLQNHLYPIISAYLTKGSLFINIVQETVIHPVYMTHIELIPDFFNLPVASDILDDFHSLIVVSHFGIVFRNCMDVNLQGFRLPFGTVRQYYRFSICKIDCGFPIGFPDKSYCYSIHGLWFKSEMPVRFKVSFQYLLFEIIRDISPLPPRNPVIHEKKHDLMIVIVSRTKLPI